MVGRLLSYWEGNFSGAMLNFGRVYIYHVHAYIVYIDIFRYIYVYINIYIYIYFLLKMKHISIAIFFHVQCEFLPSGQVNGETQIPNV